MIRFFCFIVLLCTAVATTTTTAAAEYQLDIARQTVTITGNRVDKITVNGSIPGPVLHWTEGEDVVVHVTNHLTEPTSIHWHGLLLPGAMDGVQGFNGFPGIAPGSTFTYRFTLRQHGTYWYHAHTLGQEQDGLYGALVIAPRNASQARRDHDDVLLVSDFTDEPSGTVLAHLKMASDYYNRARRTAGDFLTDVRRYGLRKAWSDAAMWSSMRMSPTDLSDVSGYTFLVNGKPPSQEWTAQYQPGDSVRLRFINGSAMSIYDLRIIDTSQKSLPMTVVQADGQDVEPVVINEFRFAPGETYDVQVVLPEASAYRVVAEPIDRSGFALAALVTQQGAVTVQPQHRPRAQLSMADMGMTMDMSTMDHSQMSDADMEAMARDMRSGWADAGTPPGDKALAYDDLRFAGTQADQRDAQREITVHLGGNMQRYIWTLDGKTFDQAEPIRLRYGERVRLTFINDTMMAHPMHLHGMFVQLDNGQALARLPNKHTVIVPPGQTVSVLLTADESGEWAFHCHLLYHMASGMMNKVVVASAEPVAAAEKHNGH